MPASRKRTVSMRKHTNKTASEQEAAQAGFLGCGGLGNGVKLEGVALRKRHRGAHH